MGIGSKLGALANVIVPGLSSRNKTVARLKPAVEKSIFGRLPGGTIVRIEQVMIPKFRGVCYPIEVQRTGLGNLVSLGVDGAPIPLPPAGSKTVTVKATLR